MYAKPVRGGVYSECRFKDYKKHLMDKDFEGVYGDRFRMFRNKEDADKFAEKQVNAWVSRVVNYRPCDIEDGGKVKPNATKYTVGWLVSMVNLRRIK